MGARQQADECIVGRRAGFDTVDHELHLPPRALQPGRDCHEDASVVVRRCQGGCAIGLASCIRLLAERLCVTEQSVRESIRLKFDVDAVEMDLRPDEERSDEIEGVAFVIRREDPDDLRRGRQCTSEDLRV